MLTMNCVECDGPVEVENDVMLGEILECPECAVELEVVNVSPLVLEQAPEVEEDWGE